MCAGGGGRRSGARTFRPGAATACNAACVSTLPAARPLVRSLLPGRGCEPMQKCANHQSAPRFQHDRTSSRPALGGPARPPRRGHRPFTFAAVRLARRTGRGAGCGRCAALLSPRCLGHSGVRWLHHRGGDSPRHRKGAAAGTADGAPRVVSRPARRAPDRHALHAPGGRRIGPPARAGAQCGPLPLLLGGHTQATAVHSPLRLRPCHGPRQRAA